MREIVVTHLNNEDEIRSILIYFSPYFHNQAINNIETIGKLSKKFHSNGHVIYATEDNLPLGFCAYYANDYTNYNAYLSMIIVVSAAQGMGIGKTLLKKVIDDCRIKGMRYIRLEVAKDNNLAICFYEKNGFHFEREASQSSCQYVLAI